MSTPPTPLKPPQNRSRIVIEGLDKPLPRPKLKDRIKIDPFRPGYKWPVTDDPVERA
jgi:hypothetical protein